MASVFFLIKSRTFFDGESILPPRARSVGRRQLLVGGYELINRWPTCSLFILVLKLTYTLLKVQSWKTYRYLDTWIMLEVWFLEPDTSVLRRLKYEKNIIKFRRQLQFSHFVLNSNENGLNLAWLIPTKVTSFYFEILSHILCTPPWDQISRFYLTCSK